MIIDLNPNPATEKQLDYIDSLRCVYDLLPLTDYERSQMSFDEASEIIEKLKGDTGFDRRAGLWR